MPKLTGLDVICPMCAESYLETTNKFKPTIDANAGMLTLKQAYTGEAGNQWTGPPPDPTAGYGMLECPGCEAPLAPSGYLIVVDEKGELIKMGKDQEPKELVCPHCQREFKKKAHLGSHMRVHKNETKDRD